MDFDIDAIKEYKGHIYINGVQCLPNNIEAYLEQIPDSRIVIDMIPGVQQIIVQPWMTNLNSLYNFHINMNGGVTMPSTVMYGKLVEHTDKLYFAELSIAPGANVCWRGFIPRSAIISIGVV